MNEKISVIMPVYKVKEDLLRNSIGSVLNQKYRNFELLIIDDGSPDQCGKICDEYSSDKVKVVHKTNGGASSARNVGLDIATGEYFTFVDADDCVSESYLSYLCELIHLSNSDISICCCEYLSSPQKRDRQEIDMKNVILNKEDAIDALCYMKMQFSGNEMTSVWGKLYKKVTVSNIRFDERMSVGEDFAFNYHCFCRITSVVIGCKKKYIYNDISNGLIRGKFSEKKYQTLLGLYELTNLNECKYKDAVLSRVTNIAIILFLMISAEDKKIYREERKNIILFINQWRLKTIKNKKTRKKVRLSLLLTYISYDFMKKIYNLSSNNT